MLKKIILSLFSLLVFNNIVFSQGNIPVDTGAEITTSRIIVKWRAGAGTEDQKRNVYASLNSKKLKDFAFGTIITAPSRSQTAYVISELRKRSDIESVEADYYSPPQALYTKTYYNFGLFATPNDPALASQYQISNMNLTSAWDLTTGNNIIFAATDSGCQSDHPDLQANLISGYNFYDNNTNTADPYRHGTMVAGTVAAVTNNSVGMAGAGWNVKHMPIRVSDATGYAYWSTVSTGVKYAADNGAKAVNASFNMWGSTSAIDAASYLYGKGGVFTISAGNQSTLYYERANIPKALVVGAIDSANNIASWSNRGPGVDVVAPGVNVYTTITGSTYTYASGTSFSAPLTAGVVTLMYSVNPNITPQQVIRIIKSTATDLGTAGHDLTYSWGKVNAQAAVQAAKDLPLLGISDTLDPKGYIFYKDTSLVDIPDLNNITGTMNLYVHSVDNFDVQSVVLTMNNSTLYSVNLPTSSLKIIPVNTTLYPNGTYTLTLTTTDTSNRTHTLTQNITIANATDTTPPTVSLSAPLNGATVSGTITTSATASDNVAVSKVSFYVDNVLYANVANSPYTTPLNTKNYSNGSHVIKATAFDGQNNQTSSTATVTFSNVIDSTPPTISITSPASGTKVRNTVKIYVNATDNVAVTKVELYVDGVLTSASSTSPFTTNWNPKNATSGNHTIYCKAYDAAGNTANSASIILVK